jgi:hypothetical protein
MLDPFWHERAACRDKTWMSRKGYTEQARMVCAACPVLVECKIWALTAPEAVGIPGIVAGLSPVQRGQVECISEGCETVVPREKTRKGQCWTCYTAIETFVVPGA